MGWSGGSSVMAEVVTGFKSALPDAGTRRAAYAVLIPVFRANDCDTLTECFDLDPVFIEAYRQVDPSEDGYQAAMTEGAPEDANPHPPGSAAARSWHNGWRDWHRDNDGGKPGQI